MNEKYQLLKKEYEEIGTQIQLLHRKQGEIRNQMEKVCTHQHLTRLEMEPFDLDDESEVRFKCKDCYKTFSQKDVKAISNKL